MLITVLIYKRKLMPILPVRARWERSLRFDAAKNAFALWRASPLAWRFATCPIGMTRSGWGAAVDSDTSNDWDWAVCRPAALGVRPTAPEPIGLCLGSCEEALSSTIESTEAARWPRLSVPARKARALDEIEYDVGRQAVPYYSSLRAMRPAM